MHLAHLPTAREGVALYEQFVSYYRGDYRHARPLLQQLSVAAAGKQHLYISGRSRLILAAMATREARFSEADDLYQECIALFEAAGEAAYLASAHAIVATVRREQGDDRAAWQFLHQALIRLPLIASSRHVYSILTSAMTVSLGTGMTGLAVHFSRLLVATARDWNNPVAVVSALADEAEQRLRFGDAPGARQRLDEARAALVSVTDAKVRPVSAAHLARTEARILSATHPCDAIPLYSAAIDTLEHVAPYQVAKVFLGRGLAHHACGASAAAEKDLRAGIRVFEAQRSGQREIVLQISYFDEVWDLYGQLVRLLAVERGEVESALAVAEQSRARSLLDTLRYRPAQLPLASLRAALDPQTTVLSYIALADDLLVWAISRDGIRFHRSSVTSDDLRGAVERWRTSVQAGGDDKLLAWRLFEMLVRPVESHIRENGRLIVIGDGPLHGLPFAALWDGHRYLVERTAVWTAPSLHWLWSALQPRASDNAMRGRMLAVGDPEFPPEQFPRLLRLPGAAREAIDAAAPYRRRLTLTGAAATRDAVLKGLKEADVVHVAAHAVPNLVDPELSYVVAAAGLSPGGATVTAKAIASLGPLPTRLVVLSACQTAAGRVARGEGVLSLARAFMAAGIPTIVGNLWDVSDSSSYSLHIRLHEGWAQGLTVASALRSSQLQLLRGASAEDRKPRVWAAVVGLGSPYTAIGDTPISPMRSGEWP
jgi:CHAT domain-containing protein